MYAAHVLPAARDYGTLYHSFRWQVPAHYNIGGDAWQTRYSPLNQITPANFEKLVEAWNFSDPAVGAITARSTPVYVGGKLLSVAGPRRHVVSIDPVTGKTLWTFVEPPTPRAEYSMRAAYGKGIAYAEIDGRGVVYITTPGFFLVALDAATGRPLQNWGRPVPIKDFPQTGVVDLVQRPAKHQESSSAQGRQQRSHQSRTGWPRFIDGDAYITLRYRSG